MATQAQIKSFIDLIAPIVQKKCKERGWGVPSAIIAQAGIESAWGTSSLWKTCYNGWGMKWKSGCGCDYKEYKTNEQKADGTYYTVSAKFRKYPDAESGIEGYFKFIESYARYKPVMQAKTYTEYATQIKNCGWATSINYTNNIINTVKARSLTVYDGGSATTITTTKTAQAYYAKYTGTSSSIVSVLKAIGEKDTSFTNRKKIAVANGVANYSGTASQNLQLVSLAKSGKLKKA